MTDTTRAALMVEIGRAASRLGAPATIISLMAGWETGHNDQAVLSGLRAWNDERQPTINRSGKVTIDVEIQREIYVAMVALQASIDLLCVLGSWGDTYDDAETLAAIRRYNRTGSISDL